jgi:hypothetical protein
MKLSRIKEKIDRSGDPRGMALIEVHDDCVKCMFHIMVDSWTSKYINYYDMRSND